MVSEENIKSLSVQDSCNQGADFW